MQEHPLHPLVHKLQFWAPLSEADGDALLQLPCTIRRLKAGHHIVWEGDIPQHSCLLIRGYAYRHKIVREGKKQIFSLHMDGDLIDLQNSLLGRADHNVETLTDCEVALIPVEAIRKIAFDRPAIGMAMWYETLVEGSVFREWIANIGRRTAHARIAHLICEFATRLKAAKLGTPDGFTVPMSQEWISDAVSLTSVHVNRVLQTLQAEGLIHRSRRWIEIRDWDGLTQAGDFNPAYLHLDQVHPAAL
ncbi:Crp/Fnr family transcriptional regulator [Sphingomonas sp. LM7]|nr:Crp/Fnr family transcriptional regulator [Sphingomonas sp. LM7]